MACSFLYFDLGNVLLSFCHDRMCRQMAEVAGLDTSVVKRALFDVDHARMLQLQFESGNISAQDYYDYFCRQTGSQPDRATLEHAGSDIFDVMEPSARLVQSLAAAGNRLAILSNVGAVHWEFVTDGRFPFLQSAFEFSVCSFEARSVKPEPAIYQSAIDRAGVPAEEIFFVDDREENVAGALAAGIDAVQFTDAEQLQIDLQRRNIVGA